MKKIALLVILFVVNASVYAQGEASNWYFGYGGGVSFDPFTGVATSLNDGNLFTNEGCASISDNFGNLLFYTDGSTIWNKEHDVMMGGTDLFGDASSTQSAIIVPKPSHPDSYYVFTVDNELDGFNYGLNYSEVDMRRDEGRGEVTTKNINLLGTCSEKLTAVLKDCETESLWVIAFSSENGIEAGFNTYHAFEVSNVGVSATPVKSTFSSLSVFDARGNLKLSPDGTKMAVANVTNNTIDPPGNNRLLLYDFDATTGIVSNQLQLNISGLNSFPYGVEFSPNNQFLYVHSSNNYNNLNIPLANNDPTNHRSTLTQFDVTEADIQASEFAIDERQLYRGSLQLGPNGKIYRALAATYNFGIPYLAVIHNPNQRGQACNYDHNGIELSPNRSTQGLPPFLTSFFNEKIDIIQNGSSSNSLSLCEGDSYTLRAPDIDGAVYFWSKDNLDLPNDTTTLSVNESGIYEVIIEIDGEKCNGLEGQALMQFKPKPVTTDYTLLQCDEDAQPNDGITRFNLNKAIEIFTASEPNLSVNFYRDASKTNRISIPNDFQNATNPQIIYVEVINTDTTCSNTSELTLAVSLTSVLNEELTTCDDDGVEDGFREFTLSNANTTILGGAPASASIAFYVSYNDALLERNKLPEQYTNTTAYSQTVYARVENENNCYGIGEIKLTVYPLPEIDSASTTAYYCTNFFPEPITLEAGVFTSDISNFRYEWTDNTGTLISQSPTIIVNQTGTYQANVIDKITGCSKVKTIEVEPSNIAKIEGFDFNDNNTYNNIPVAVIVSGDGTYQFQLEDSDGNMVAPYQNSDTFVNIKPGIYTVYVRDVKNNCGTVSDDVSIIGFPKYFTPNNDGSSDTWNVLGVSEMFQPNTKVKIYNRYGKLVKQLDPLGTGWDGTLNGLRLPTDDYWFFVTLQDGRVFKNHFTLKY
ncbi:T9SS type B sorting domain-containing protein [Hyunsoonleella sp. SJ7]|uniref:T9SS type B sorting domain-containing protein n=1 Tax=Hyunsoonleella aquatilis TaxID=2762758 RepID=A0A923HHQ0_9FLAO|nr:T9SS type B sorting domain-containing protein [Hyunsoonleella aquatilis]MBC3758582.1 T9SS type B sorting domain-containing protein [Hyunsoonleella aquatilis]